MGIVRTEGVLGGEPWIEGRRVTVLQVADRVVLHGQSPERVADQLDLSLAAVHEALAYYYGNTEEMDEIRERHRELEEDLADVATRPPTPSSSRWAVFDSRPTR